MALTELFREIAERRARVEKALKTGTLTAGDGAALMEGYAYIYKDGSVPVLGMGRSGSADVAHANEEQYAIPFIITTLSEDRDGDIVIPLGWHGENYARNPVWFFGHQQWEISIGKSTGPDGKLYVFPEEKLIRSVCFFDQHDEDAMFIYGKVMRGFINATSIAFVPIDAARRDNEYGYEKARTHNQSMMPLGWLFKEWDHTETSIVGVGSNAGAIRDSLDKEWMYITPKCRKAMGAFAAQTKGCWNGWCPSPPCQPCQTAVKKSTRPRVNKALPPGGKVFIDQHGDEFQVKTTDAVPPFKTREEAETFAKKNGWEVVPKASRIDTAYALKAGGEPAFQTGDRVVARYAETSEVPLDKVGTVVDVSPGSEWLHDPPDAEGARGDINPPQWQQPDYGGEPQAVGTQQVPLTQKPQVGGEPTSSGTTYLVDFGDRKLRIGEESLEEAPAKGGEVKQGAAGTTLGQVILPGDPAAQYAIPNRLKQYKNADRIAILNRHQRRKSNLGPMAGS